MHDKLLPSIEEANGRGNACMSAMSHCEELDDEGGGAGREGRGGEGLGEGWGEEELAGL